MHDDQPFRLTAWTKDYARRGVVRRIKQLSGAVRHNAPGEALFTLDPDNARLADLSAKGARVVIEYRPDPAAPYDEILSGTVEERSGTGAARASQRSFAVADDWQVLNEILGLPNPAGTETQQGADSAYYTVTGAAETVVCQLVGVQADAQGVTLAVPASAGRGPTISVSVRMHPLADRMFPTVDQAGLGVRIVQRGATRQLEVVEPRTFPRVLTEASGAVVNTGDWSDRNPAVTRVYVGAGGEGEARTFRFYVRAELEAELGYSRARFVDARDVPATDPQLDTILAARADEAFAEGGAKVGLKVALIESPRFRYAKTFRVGDRVSVQLAGAPVLTDYVREAQFSWTPDAGASFLPLIGEWNDSTDDLIMRDVAELQRAVADLQRR